MEATAKDRKPREVGGDLGGESDAKSSNMEKQNHSSVGRKERSVKNRRVGNESPLGRGK